MSGSTMWANEVTTANAGERLGFAGKSRLGLSLQPGVAEFVRRLHDDIHVSIVCSGWARRCSRLDVHPGVKHLAVSHQQRSRYYDNTDIGRLRTCCRHLSVRHSYSLGRSCNWYSVPGSVRLQLQSVSRSQRKLLRFTYGDAVKVRKRNTADFPTSFDDQIPVVNLKQPALRAAL